MNRLAHMSPAALLLGLLALASASCEDLRGFEGEWAGTVSADPQLRQGFAAEAPLALTLASAARAGVQATLTLPGRAPLPFLPMKHAAADALGNMQLDGEPFRSFLGFVEPPGEAAILVVLSMFPDDRVEVRLVRGAEELYGVFALRRTSRQVR